MCQERSESPAGPAVGTPQRRADGPSRLGLPPLGKHQQLAAGTSLAHRAHPPSHSTFQMAIFPSSRPAPLSTYLSSAEHSVFTVSAWANSSFSTVLLSASIT